MDDDADEALDLQSEANDVLTQLLISNERQLRYLERIHYWVRFMGWVLLVSIVFGTIGLIAATIN